VLRAPSPPGMTMCGIVGVLNLADEPPVELHVLERMLAMVRHRGPDEFGLYRDAAAGLGSARLSIIDLSGGSQPIGSEDGCLWIVFNGEIFNYVELRPELEARGHRFSTCSDTEVVLHLYEEQGPECLGRLNGQFAMAIWDARKRELFLARDRLGIRPLFYASRNGRLVFGSEIKSILAYPGMEAQIDPDSLDQVFSYWSTLAPRSAFRGIYEIPPAHYLLARRGSLSVHRYWALDFTAEPEGRRPEGEYREELESLLSDASRIRLRADVPVGAYLSGGLDSAITTAVARRHASGRVQTFSIAFDNPEFDESGFQRLAAEFLGTEHRTVHCTHADIARVFPDVIWHTEAPVLRTAPAPLFLLSRLVRDHRLKVVLTGEGADEILGGYEIFKEMKIRRFWARRPDSNLRPQLLRRLYPDIAGFGGGPAFLFAFFRRNLTDTDDPFYSHLIRWNNNARNRRFLLRDGAGAHHADRIPLPENFRLWPPLGRAMYLEAAIFLSGYLLSSQGDRMAMAHSVEGRYPFLDYRVVEFAGRLPPTLKVRGLTEKWLLKQIGRRLLPPEIWRRPKRPYRAPIHRCFFPDSPAYVDELLGEPALRRSGLFKPAAVAQLVRKARTGVNLSEVEDMALAGILSTQLLHHRFVRDFNVQELPAGKATKLVDRIGRT
jgi:asparagine synthase (glutamine-hydrolysing)